MIRVTRPLLRHPSLTAREFFLRHAAFADLFRAEPSLRRYVRAYVASSTILTQIPGQPPRRFDGLSDLWFDDVGSYEAFERDGVARASIETMSRSLFAAERTPAIVLTERTPLIDGGLRSPGIFDTKKIRMTTLLARKPSLSFADFVSYHRRTHAPLFASTPIVKRNVRRYAIAHRVDAANAANAAADATERPYDGVADFWFDNMFDLVTTFVNPGYLSTVRPDERRFLDLKACAFIISRELGSSES